MRSLQCDPYFVALSREILSRGTVAARTNGGLRREGRRLVLCGGGRAALTALRFSYERAALVSLQALVRQLVKSAPDYTYGFGVHRYLKQLPLVRRRGKFHYSSFSWRDDLLGESFQQLIGVCVMVEWQHPRIARETLEHCILPFSIKYYGLHCY